MKTEDVQMLLKLPDITAAVETELREEEGAAEEAAPEEEVQGRGFKMQKSDLS